jgi:ankyrin repeat protein
MSNFDSLPVELLEVIYNQLNFVDLLRLRVTSKLFRSTLMDWNFWSHRAYDQINFPSAQFIMTSLEWPHHRYHQLLNFRREPHEHLMIAAQHGDIKAIDDILQLNRPDMGLDYVLRAAAQYGQMDVMKRLLLLDYDYYYDDTFHRAASHGHIEIVQYLADLSGPQNKLRLKFDEALRGAAGAGYRNIIDFLYQRKEANFDFDRAARHAARHAAYQGQLEIVQYLITLSENEIDPNELLLGATRGNQIKVAAYFIQAGATDLSGALFEASIHGQTEMVKFLLEPKTDSIGSLLEPKTYPIRILNESLYEAARYGYLDIVKTLIQAGANDLNQAVDSARNSWTHRGRRHVQEYLESLLTAQGSVSTHPILSLARTTVPICVEVTRHSLLVSGIMRP